MDARLLHPFRRGGQGGCLCVCHPSVNRCKRGSNHLGSFLKIRASSRSIFWTRFLATKTWATGTWSF
jgi:hypothetical protein